jgi:hypothetical protein
MVDGCRTRGVGWVAVAWTLFGRNIFGLDVFVAQVEGEVALS